MLGEEKMGQAMAGLATELMLNPRLQVRHILIPADYEEDRGHTWELLCRLVNPFSVSKYLYGYVFF